MSKLYAFVADGMEEVECLAVVDIARRGGIQVELISIMGRREVTGSHNITVLADRLFEETVFQPGDVLFLPGGGKGVENLTAHGGLAALLKDAAARGDRIAAICAAPSILGQLGLLKGKRAVCFPGFEEQLFGAVVLGTPVCLEGHILTARGAGVAVDFALKLVEALADERLANKIRMSMQCM